MSVACRDSLGRFLLDRDYFAVSEAEMRRTRPILTIVDGEVAYDAGVLQRDRRQGDDDD